MEQQPIRRKKGPVDGRHTLTRSWKSFTGRVRAPRKEKAPETRQEKASSFSLSQPSVRTLVTTNEIFGVSLDVVMKSDDKRRGFRIPPFLERLCLHIEETCIKVEGIFRKSAPSEEVDKLRNRVNDGEDLDFSTEPDLDPIVACDLLKMFLRQLPDPLLTFELYDCFLAKAKVSVRLHTKVDLVGTMSLLPELNQAILKRLIICLKKVKENSEDNKMNASNLGLIFGPSLLQAPQDERNLKDELLNNYQYVNAIALAFIEDFDMLFQGVKYSPRYHCYAKAFQAYTATSRVELSLAEGDIVLVTDRREDCWWEGELRGLIGYFPASFCVFMDGTCCYDESGSS